MNFTKERNFIVAYDYDGKCAGQWNILTGEFIGKSGKVVRSVPSAFVYNNICQYRPIYPSSEFYSYAIYLYRSESTQNYTPARAARFESLISVGLYPDSFCDLDSNVKLSKDLVQYLADNNHHCFSSTMVNRYVIERDNKDFLENRPQWFIDAFYNTINELPHDYVKSFLNRALLEHVDSYLAEQGHEYYVSSYMSGLVRNYYKKCHAMYGQVKIQPNILSNYAHILYLYEEYSKTHYDEILQKMNDVSALYFQSGNYMVRPLLTKKDFHDEATYQNNCVERLYMNKVYSGYTHVVVVRNVNNPDTPLVTCEVSNDGEIIQYLGRFNSSIRSADTPELYNFRTLYQSHLSANMGRS